jgi:hypothetical protein
MMTGPGVHASVPTVEVLRDELVLRFGPLAIVSIAFTSGRPDGKLRVWVL